MDRETKAQQVEELTELFGSAEGIILADASGVDVNTINLLRSAFRKEGVTFRVVKNTLARRALEATGKEALAPSFRGPTAIAIKPGDPVSPAKIALGFSKEHDKFKVKGGLLGTTLLDAAGVEAVSKMRGRDELRADLLSLLKAPQTQLVGICNTMVSQFVGLLSARSRKLEEGDAGEAAA